MPFDVNVFYGNASHGVLLVPRADLAEDMEYEVRVDDGVPFIDGTSSTASSSFTFSTAPYPGEVLPYVPPPRCGCGTSSASPLGLVVLGALAAARALTARR